MKKIIAIALVLVALFSLSIESFAALSPTGEEYVEVTVREGIPSEGNEGGSMKLRKGARITASSDPNEGTFDSWRIYKRDGSVAVEGVDYKIVSGSLKTKNLTIELLNDVVICGNYNGMITDPKTGEKKKDESPKTGDNSVVYLSLVMLGAAALVISAKKKLCK